jgi:hypothetical protein
MVQFRPNFFLVDGRGVRFFQGVSDFLAGGGCVSSRGCDFFGRVCVVHFVRGWVLFRGVANFKRRGEPFWGCGGRECDFFGCKVNLNRTYVVGCTGIHAFSSQVL